MCSQQPRTWWSCCTGFSRLRCVTENYMCEVLFQAPKARACEPHFMRKMWLLTAHSYRCTRDLWGTNHGMLILSVSCVCLEGGGGGVLSGSIWTECPEPFSQLLHTLCPCRVSEGSSAKLVLKRDTLAGCKCNHHYWSPKWDHLHSSSCSSWVTSTVSSNILCNSHTEGIPQTEDVVYFWKVYAVAARPCCCEV